MRRVILVATGCLLLAGLSLCGCATEVGHEFVLTVSGGTGGSVIAPGQGAFSYDAGTVVDLMAEAPMYYQVHVVIGLLLFCLWPFSRLVHVFSVPIAYLFRPYIVYRSRDGVRPGDLVGAQPHRRGW